MSIPSIERADAIRSAKEAYEEIKNSSARRSVLGSARNELNRVQNENNAQGMWAAVTALQELAGRLTA